MPSPFHPAMDPFIESQGRWLDFHSSLLTEFRNLLNDSLPGQYVAQLQERVHLLRPDEDELRAVFSDVAIFREDRPGVVPAGGEAVAVLEPVTRPVVRTIVEEAREVWVEIVQLPEEDLVTVIEMLSPTNKGGSGRNDYLVERSRYLDSPAHLVEIDCRVVADAALERSARSVVLYPVSVIHVEGAVLVRHRHLHHQFSEWIADQRAQRRRQLEEIRRTLEVCTDGLVRTLVPLGNVWFDHEG